MVLDARALAIQGRLTPTDIAVEAGQLVALVGPNGGGKTSLLRALAGVEESTGAVSIDGSVVERREPRRMSLMSASRDIGWPIPVRDVVTLGLADRQTADIDRLLEQFELTAFAARPVNSLSTGERARVLMARATAPRPRVLLLDEPLSNLDPYWVLRFLAAMRDHARSGATVLCALHDLALLDRFDRALLISEGRIQVDGSPEALLANSRFPQIFRVAPAPEGGWQLRPEDPRSSR